MNAQEKFMKSEIVVPLIYPGGRGSGSKTLICFHLMQETTKLIKERAEEKWKILKKKKDYLKGSKS